MPGLAFSSGPAPWAPTCWPRGQRLGPLQAEAAGQGLSAAGPSWGLGSLLLDLKCLPTPTRELSPRKQASSTHTSLFSEAPISAVFSSFLKQVSLKVSCGCQRFLCQGAGRSQPFFLNEARWSGVGASRPGLTCFHSCGLPPATLSGCRAGVPLHARALLVSLPGAGDPARAALGLCRGCGSWMQSGRGTPTPQPALRLPPHILGVPWGKDPEVPEMN